MRAAYFLWVGLLAFGGACASPPDIEKRPDEKYVSIIQLIANPEGFDDKNISVGGYLELSDEIENSLFLDQTSQKAGMSANSIAVDFDGATGDIKEHAKQLNGTYVIIAGRFKARPTAFSGGRLNDVYRIIPVPASED